MWAAEAFARGEECFYAEPVDWDEPYGVLKLAKPRYVYTYSRALTEEEFEAVFGEEKNNYVLQCREFAPDIFLQKIADISFV